MEGSYSGILKFFIVLSKVEQLLADWSVPGQSNGPTAPGLFKEQVHVRVFVVPADNQR